MKLITTTDDLAAFCKPLAATEFIAVDTEFMRERTYWPKLCLAQVAGPDDAAAIDALAEGIDLAPLDELMANAKVLKVFHAARQDVEQTIGESVPMNLRNAPTRLMKEWGYSAGYQHAHNLENSIPDMDCLPPSLAGRRYYFPTDRGLEKTIGERLEEIRRLKEKT